MGFAKVLSGSDLDKEVRLALSQFVDKCKTFTAYDITLQIRKNIGDSVEVCHNDVRPKVHDLMFPDATYSRSFDGTKYVYKSINKPLIQPLGSGFLQVTAPAVLPPIIDRTFDASIARVFVEARSEGRVTVPASTLKHIGVNPGDNVYVHININGNALRIAKHFHSYPHFIFKTDKYGSFRLRKNMTSGFKKFEVKIDSQDVLLIGK